MKTTTDYLFVEREEELIGHIFEVLEFNECVDILGLPYKALVFREFDSKVLTELIQECYKLLDMIERRLKFVSGYTL